MGKWWCILCWLLPVAEAFVGQVRLDLDFAPQCSAGATVVLAHPGCRPSPWFPAVLLQNDASNGNATLLYGWSSNLQDGWTRATAVPAGSLTFYQCLQEEWRPDGERGRGYDFLPSCDGTNCVTGCIVSDAAACNKSRMQLGEVCSIPCERDGVVDLPCDALAWPEQRSVECLAKIVYCDEVGNATGDETGCVDRNGGTTSTTVPQSERYFQGCGELQLLTAGVVAMPDNQMVSGAYYFEIGVGDGKAAGFVDSAWTNQGDHQWLSTSPGSSGHIGLAVRFLTKERAEIRFSWDGVWGNAQQIQFSQYLVPVVFAEESSWRIPADAWLFLAPSIIYGPLTRRRFPNVCNFPLDFEMMVQPPVCRNGLRALGSLEECSEAGLHLGVLTDAIEGFFQGFPSECFLCEECDNGDLFWNNASGADAMTETIRQAPSAGALCRRGPSNDTQASSTVGPTQQAEFYMAAGTCPSHYLQIFNATVCEAAALDLGLGFQTVAAVSLPTAPLDGAVYWPIGCFYCPLCDTAHLFLNDRPEGINNSEELVSVSPTPSQVNSATSTWLLCQSVMDPQTTSTLPWLWTLPVTTTEKITWETTVQETTTAESTTFPLATAGIVYLGDVQCENPYQVAVQLQWWEDPNMLMLIGGGVALCGLASVCLWFWGICHQCCSCLGRLCCCCMRQAAEAVEAGPPDELIFFDPPPGWKPTKVPGLVL